VVAVDTSVPLGDDLLDALTARLLAR
jgi:hypothetical protein